jgi:ATP-dependent DNA helicase 2 subunit 2
VGVAIRQAQDSRNGMSFQKTGVPFSPTAQIFNGRKTDQCGVVVFGSEGSQSPLSRALITLTHSCGIETNNVVHDKNGGYEHVSEYIPIAQPNATTLAKLDALKPSESSGDRAYTLIFHILF